MEIDAVRDVIVIIFLITHVSLGMELFSTFSFSTIQRMHITLTETLHASTSSNGSAERRRKTLKTKHDFNNDFGSLSNVRYRDTFDFMNEHD